MLAIRHLPFPVLRIDGDGKVGSSNGVLERELGRAVEALRGRRLEECVEKSSRADVASWLAGSAHDDVLTLSFTSAGKSLARNFYTLGSGGARWLIGQPASFDEQRAALLAAHQRAEAQADEYARVSQELRQANEQLATRAQSLKDATEAKARFLATMSHELRTPLNAVLGYGGLLRDGVYGPTTSTQQRAVQALVRRAKDLQLLIDDVLDLSKIEAGRIELRVDQFLPSAVLAEVRDEVADAARRKDISVVVRTESEHRVRLDRAKYRQIVLSLAVNAVKFTPGDGEVELSVSMDDGGRFVTRVRDTGIGIAKEHLNAIFESFEQVEAGTTRRYQGVGLGLSIVRHIVELLNGRIAVDSQPGVGTTFRVTLPVLQGPDASAESAETIPDDAQLAGDPIVVAIDDDPEVIALLRDSLAPAHFRVVGALNGDRGVELARILRPFAITLDITMPEKDGWEVLRMIKAEPQIADIPVIIMSIVSERSLGYSLGVADYLVKPVDRRVLIHTLERLRKRPSSRTAVVADPDEDASALLHDLLVSLGFTVRECQSGEECLTHLRSDVPDLLFIDVGMGRDHVGAIFDEVTRGHRYDSMRTVIVAPNDGVAHAGPWARKVTAAIVRGAADDPAELLDELKRALATAGV